jgi:hypothetical protein
MRVRVTALAFAAAASFPPIPLPVPPDLAPNVAAALGPVEANEALQVAPGAVDDLEVVTVGIDRSGAPRSVTVEQRLTVHGTGDFRLRIAGPALDVAPLADTTVTPGLQRGAVVWQGFVAGQRLLGARVTLDARQEQFRVPLSITVRGHELVLHNQTAQPVDLVDADPDPTALARVSSAVRDRLAARQRPLAGRDGLPRTLAARSPSTVHREPVAVPLAVTGTVTMGTGRRSVDTVVDSADVRVPAPFPVTAIDLQVAAALPSPDAISTGADRASLRSLELVLAGAAAATALDAYLGNPNPGASATAFRYRTVAPAPVHRTPKPRAQPLTLALAGVAALMVVGTGVTWWRHN